MFAYTLRRTVGAVIVLMIVIALLMLALHLGGAYTLFPDNLRF